MTDFAKEKLFEQAEIARYTPQEQMQYEESKKILWDNYSTHKTAHDKGVVEGKELGRSEANRDTARKLKAMNVLNIEQIAEVTGLTIEEIQSL
jgi:predicted transposase/invertase (TIGR01784 family)